MTGQLASPENNAPRDGAEKLRVLDLFSGIGALALGLERAGMEIVAHCENAPYAAAVLRKHWPNTPNLGDITKADFHGIEADIIAAGFPCQDISNAGKRAGITGDRSGLFRCVIDAASAIRPQVILLENVEAIRFEGRGLVHVLGELATLGYDAEWHCIPASYVGAPHNRDRIWIVAHSVWSEWREEPYRRALGRMGRVQQSVPWDRDWQSALREFRRVDDGSAYRVDRIDTIRNAVVPQIPELIGRAILQALHERPALPSQSPTRGAGAVSLLGAAPASVSNSFHSSTDSQERQPHHGAR